MYGIQCIVWEVCVGLLYYLDVVGVGYGIVLECVNWFQCVLVEQMEYVVLFVLFGGDLLVIFVVGVQGYVFGLCFEYVVVEGGIGEVI